MNYTITSVNMKYKDETVSEVIISFSARNNERTLNINGNFTLTADEYNKDSSISALNEKAKQHVLDELQK